MYKTRTKFVNRRTQMPRRGMFELNIHRHGFPPIIKKKKKKKKKKKYNPNATVIENGIIKKKKTKLCRKEGYFNLRKVKQALIEKGYYYYYKCDKRKCKMYHLTNKSKYNGTTNKNLDFLKEIPLTPSLPPSQSLPPIKKYEKIRVNIIKRTKNVK